MRDALASQPVSIELVVGSSEFQLYKEGLFDNGCTSCGNKWLSVLAVGYVTGMGQDYWIVKNSWGTSWGENGYIRLYFTDGCYGQCDFLEYNGYYPIIGSVKIMPSSSPTTPYPSQFPSVSPTIHPTKPTVSPSYSPSKQPSTSKPTVSPSYSPS